MQLLTYMHEGIYTRVRDTCTGCGGEMYTEVGEKHMHRDLSTRRYMTPAHFTHAYRKDKFAGCGGARL